MILKKGLLAIIEHLSYLRLSQRCDNRKARLFATSVEGAKASVHLYSLVETAKANGLEPHSYIQHVLTRLPAAQSLEDIEALLPFNEEAEQYQAT